MLPIVSPRRPPSHAGFALVIVLGFLVLLTILVVAFFTSVTTDYATTKQYSNGAATKQLADSVVQVAMGQIKLATAGANLTWASQPGMIRTYDTSGAQVTNYKLYSSRTMTTSGPLTLTQISDYDAAWRTKTAAWTDLNAPVTLADGATVNFPIIDGNKIVPLASIPATGAGTPLSYDAVNNQSGASSPDGQPDVQGFSVNLPTQFSFDSTKPVSTTNTPVPMPVTWLYQLRDGTLIAPDAGSATTATFTGVPTAQQPTASNPIVGRVAFWTDDETSKVNINTACGDEWNPAQVTPGATPGPTPAGTTAYTAPGAYWDVPRAYTGYDYNNLALIQPVQHEYQRYPGHPAGVYLSAVLPGITRNQIFSLIPRIGGGGSQGGTTLASTTLTPDADRLYASIDELLFAPPVAGTTRTLNDASRNFLSKSSLERAKFFLTANSRAPEVNLFNKPRIAIWPVDQDVVAKAASGAQSPRGTAFDSLIAFCAHLGPLGNGNDYVFQRSANGYLSATQDYDLNTTGGTQRNHLLYAYLQNMANARIPGFGGILANKFGSDTNQVLTEIFDYVRCVNPSDDNIAFLSTDPITKSPTNDANCYTPAEQYTANILAGGYTGPQILNPKPYHALIVPTKIGNTQGFGRTVTLSEVGLAFICNADGTSTAAVGCGDGTSTAANPLWTGAATPGDGGLATLLPGTTTIIYSDFPPLKEPLPTQAQIAAHPFFKTAPGYQVANVYGFDKTNWNKNLPLYDWSADPTGTLWTGLKPGQRRVQAMLLMNPYTVSPGYSTMHMDIGLQVSGLSGIGAGGLGSIGFQDGKTLVMSNPTYRTPTFGVNFPFFHNSYLAPYNTLIDASASSPTKYGDPAGPLPIGNLRYPPYRTYEFVSSPFTVTLNAGNTMQVTSARPVTISIWHLCPADEAAQSLGNPTAASALVQTLNLDFAALAGLWPVPTLYAPTNAATTDTNLSNIAKNAAVEWDFSWAGAFPNLATPIRGRFFDSVGNSGHYFEPAFIANDVVRTMVPGYPTDAVGPGGDYRLLAAQNSLASGFVPHRMTIDTTTGTTPAPYTITASFKQSFPMLFSNGQVLNFEEQMDVGQTAPSSAYTRYSNVSQAPFGALITSVPPNAAFASNVNNLLPVKTGDFDNGLGSDMDGPYINKPDTGYNYNPGSNTYPYFGIFAENSTAGYFSPNRQIPSPGMFGSLPVGVVRKMPWQTLLFRPQPTHPDGVPVPDLTTTSVPAAPYGGTAADHLIMDWFWMPVVEPYAISEPFSTAGKINMNYQIAPFTYITRATALDALLKSQRMLAIPTNTAPSQYWKQPLNYDANPNVAQGGYLPGGADYRSDLNLSNTTGTLRQFEETFNSGDLFRSPTQICDIYLTPQDQKWTQNQQAENFWAVHQLTGDNSRERPYANLYGCLTTKSNTYTVHFRVQSLQKVPGTPVAQWMEGRDVVSGDYRGATQIERYVDTGDAALPDFTTNTTATLDSYYKFRVISNRRFAP